MSADIASAEIHPTAIVEPDAVLGSGVTIGPMSYVQSGAVIGAGTTLGPHVTVLGHTTVGKRCRIHAGTVLGDLPQDLSFEGVESFVRIGDDCWIREHVTVHRGTEEGSVTEIGNECLLMATSHVAHNCRVGERVILANGVALGGRVEVGDGVFAGGGSMVHQFCRVGRLAMLSGLTAVKRDVPPFMMTRTQTTCVMSLNTVGLRRAGISAEERRELKKAFRLLYRSGLNVSQAVERMGELEGECARELVEFIGDSRRGISAWIGD
jgi:UDP-N-acetylglucosamine acyltransferase